MAARLAAKPAYSYRADTNVPRFDDSQPVIIYDGVCVLCSRSMRAIAARDTAGHFRFASAQSALGRALYAHYGLDVENFETVLLVENGSALGKLDMPLAIARVLGGPWRLFGLFRPLPQKLRDRAYDLVAQSRYRLFGRSETCMVPDASWRRRVVEGGDA